jgi:hypothetical protein
LLGTSSSRTSDNEHAAAALRDSEVLRVQYRPRRIEPEFFQPGEDGGEVTSSIAG